MRSGLKALAAALIILAAVSAAPALMKPGEKFRPFSLKNIDGKAYTVTMEDGRLTLLVAENVNGQQRVRETHPGAVLIDFWATWCVPCRAAMPYMQQIYDRYKPAPGQEKGGLILLGIDLDDQGSKVVRPFYEKLKITYPMLADATTGPAPDGLIRSTREMGKVYEAQVIPVVYLIDAGGRIVHVHQGFKKEHIAELEEAVKKALSGDKA
jgi:thiol-disulfide isomerase/thioredoxin